MMCICVGGVHTSTVDPRSPRPQISLELQTVGSCPVWVPVSFCPPGTNLEQPQERDSRRTNCRHPAVLWLCLWGIFPRLLIDAEGPTPVTVGRINLKRVA